MDQSKAGASAEAKKRQDDLLATLSARSQQETRVADRIRTLEGERDKMRDHRSMRDKRYEEQRAAGPPPYSHPSFVKEITQLIPVLSPNPPNASQCCH